MRLHANAGKFKPVGFEVKEVDTLHDLLPRADFVALTLPLTPESTGLIGERELELMKDTAFLINVSRGPHVDSDALTDAIREEKSQARASTWSSRTLFPESIPSTIFPTW